MKEKIKLAVIGCGVWGQAHAEIFAHHPYGKLVAVADRDEKRASEVGKRYSIPWYADYHQMLVGEECDAVGIATPDFAHAEPLLAALGAGKHVLCEKPLVTRRDDLERVNDAAIKSGCRVMVDYHNRWNPPFAITHERLATGQLGEPVNGYLRLNDTIWVPLEYLSWAASSSIIWFLGSHAVDTLSWLFGDRIKRVYSVCHEGVLRSRGVTAVDTYLSTLEFSRGGIAQIENGWITPNTNPLVNDFKLNLLCTRGMVNMDLSSSNFFEVYSEDRIEHPDFFIKPRIHGAPSGFAYAAIGDFVNRLYRDEEFIAPYEESVAVNQVLFAILESAQQREPVEVRY
ncbi:MAG: Gfo/Idh/MocA family oxidoreductase [Caldilineaceae bacterium]|nr:Gfo/Idh/MocA family oxidoreductase [Caldilineaceae bacterium]